MAYKWHGDGAGGIAQCLNAPTFVPMSASQITETRIASVVRDENGVIITTMKDCGEIDEYDVMDLNLVIRQKAQGQSSLKLLVAIGDWDMTPAAKQMAMKEDAISLTKARAIVVSNRLKASLFNFLKQFNERSYPQQFFNDKDEAYRWLVGL